MKKTALFLIAALTLLLASCDQKDLCYDHWDHAPRYDVNVVANWQLLWEYQYPGGPDWATNWPESTFGFPYSSLNPQKPSGLRCIVYNDEHSESRNIGPDGGLIYLREGKSSLLFFNNDTEYILFDNVSTSSTAVATTRTRSRSTYFGSPFSREEDEKTVNPPDYLFGHFISDYDAISSRTTLPTLSFTMKPLVFTYLIRVNFTHGIEYVAVARGALSGMAASVYLTDGHTGSELATVLFDFDIKNFGVEVPVNSFGAPDYPNPEYTRTDNKYGLNVEVRLKNGKILSYDFDVTDQLAKQPRGGVIVVGGIDIPDELGQEDSGAFGVDVNGWGEYEDVPIDIPMGTGN